MLRRVRTSRPGTGCLLALLALTNVFVVAGCDKFYGYTLWTVNTSGDDRILVLAKPGGLTDALVPTYLVPSDGLMRQTEFVVTGAASVAEPIAEEVYVFDNACGLIGSVVIQKVGGYKLLLSSTGEPRLERLDDAALPTAPEMSPAVTAGCSPAR